MHPSSILLMEDFRHRYLTNRIGCSVLDVGAMSINGQPTYRDSFREYRYVGMDLFAGPNVDIVGYDALDQYDVVISGQTMEHVRRPWEWLLNLTKYFRELICIIAPNTWVEHRFPLDCYRFFPDGMRALFEYADIAELEIRKVGIDTIGIGRHP